MQRTGWTGFAEQFHHTPFLVKGTLHLTWEGYATFSASMKKIYTYPDTDLTSVSWADLDQKNRLVYARNGCVYRHTAAGEQLLTDLNASQPHRPWLQPKEKTAPKGG